MTDVLNPRRGKKKQLDTTELTGTVSTEGGGLNIRWSGSGSGWSVANGSSGGTLTISAEQLELPIKVSGAGYSLASSSKEGPVFMFSEQGTKCGFLFSGPVLKTFDILIASDKIYTLSLLITNGSNTVWIDDPTIQFEPPDDDPWAGGRKKGKR